MTVQKTEAKKELARFLAAELTPALTAFGFKRSGLAFSASRGGNWVVLTFQLGSKSSAAARWFTATLGVWNRRVALFEDPAGGDGPPRIDECHWTCRLGELLPSAPDQWWTLDGTVHDVATGAAIRELVVRAGLPLADAMCDDERLCALWMSGTGPGLTALQRLRFLSILLLSLQRVAELPAVVRDLERVAAGKPAAAGIRLHVERLRQLAESVA